MNVVEWNKFIKLPNLCINSELPCKHEFVLVETSLLKVCGTDFMQ